jgi:protein subunit release factor A
VAILPEPREISVSVHDSDLKYEFMRSAGPGGQGVNTTDSACRLIHLPTGKLLSKSILYTIHMLLT